LVVNLKSNITYRWESYNLLDGISAFLKAHLENADCASTLLAGVLNSSILTQRTALSAVSKFYFKTTVTMTSQSSRGSHL